MKNLTEFINLCNSKVLPTSEMYNFIQEYTNNFDIKSLEYLRNDLNKYTDNVKFTFLEDTVNDGTVDRPTTVFHYLKIVNEIAPFVLTPRQKINLILNDLQEQQINYYDNESIFSYEFDQFLKFSDMVEQEYKDKMQQEIKAPDTSTPVKLTTKLNQIRMKAIHQWLTEKKYIDVDVESWLYWFDLQTWINKKKKPVKIQWIGAAYHLTNVVYILCENMNKQTETAMKKAFQLPKESKFQKLTADNIKRDKEPYKSLYKMIEFSDRNIKDLQ
ncbi:MAG TPA: hypothetical protein PLP39_08875 [Flavobacterium lutivivi]|nr:hypothetical protein [Flavobacterium lutivivi]